MGNTQGNEEESFANNCDVCDLHIGNIEVSLVVKDFHCSISQKPEENENANSKGKPHNTRKFHIPNAEARRVLRQLQGKFRAHLNVDEIVPASFEENLLTESEQEALTKPNLTSHQRVDKLLHYLRTKGMGMLHVLVKCLENSDDGTGHAHKELARNIEEKLSGKRMHPKSPKRSSNNSYHPYARKPLTDYYKPKRDDTTLYGTRPIETFMGID